jgi:hypothetical protein
MYATQWQLHRPYGLQSKWTGQMIDNDELYTQIRIASIERPKLGTVQPYSLD